MDYGRDRRDRYVDKGYLICKRKEERKERRSECSQDKNR